MAGSGSAGPPLTGIQEIDACVAAMRDAGKWAGPPEFIADLVAAYPIKYAQAAKLLGPPRASVPAGFVRGRSGAPQQYASRVKYATDGALRVSCDDGGEISVPFVLASGFFRSTGNCPLDKAGTMRLWGRLGAGAGGTVYRLEADAQYYAAKIGPPVDIPGDVADEGALPLFTEYMVGRELTPAPGLASLLSLFILRFPGTTEVRACVLMDLMGPDLGCRMRSIPPLARPSLAKLVGGRVSRTLERMHKRGHVHGDVKPDNILFHREDREGDPVLADFSLSTSAGSGSYDAMTPEYRAPEVHLGLKWGTPIDVWGLGMTILEILTGGVLPSDEYDAGRDPGPSFYLRVIRSYAGAYPDWMTKGPRALPDRAPMTRRPALTGDREADDFLEFVLIIDPRARPTAAEVAAHPYLNNNNQ